MGDCELGIGDLSQPPIPNPQYPIPNPQLIVLNKNYYYFKIYYNSLILINI